MNNKIKTISAAAITLLLLAACSSSSPLGGVFGGGSNGNGNYTNQIRGTVDSVDLSSNSIYLINVSNYNGSMLSNSGSGVRVYFDNRTTVDYQGQSYRPGDLERGDQVDIRVTQSGNQLYADSMSVTYNARNNSNPSNTYPNGNYPSNTYPNNGTYSQTLHGTVRSLDNYRRTISVDTGYNNGYTPIKYDTNTPVYFNGRNYAVTDLQIGDEIDITGSNLGSNQFRADNITVTRSISNNTNNGTYGTYGQTQSGTIRGTVSYVDTANRTIQLQSVSYTGFNRNMGSGNTITVSYDANTQVDVNGQMNPVTGLERGDVIDVQVSNNTYNNSNYFANRIYLVRDVRQ